MTNLVGVLGHGHTNASNMSDRAVYTVIALSKEGQVMADWIAPIGIPAIIIAIIGGSLWVGRMIERMSNSKESVAKDREDFWEAMAKGRESFKEAMATGREDIKEATARDREDIKEAIARDREDVKEAMARDREDFKEAMAKDRENFKEQLRADRVSAAEDRKQFRQILEDIREDIKEILRRLPPTEIVGESPIGLTDLGQAISNEVNGQDWADTGPQYEGQN